MPNTGRYSLLAMIDLNRAGSRYSAQLADGREAEVFLLNNPSLNQSIVNADPKFWVKRFRTAMLVTHPNCRKILAMDDRISPNFIAQEPRSGRSFGRIINSRSIDEPLLRQFAKASLEVLMASVAVELTTGGLVSQSIYLDANNRWVFDITGLHSPAIDRGVVSPFDAALLAPECRNWSAGELTLFEHDTSADLFSLGMMLALMVRSGSLEKTSFGARVLELTKPCLVDDPVLRPSLAHLYQNLFASALTAASAIEATAAGISFDAAASATVDTDVVIAPTPGLLVPGTQLGRYRIEEKLGEGAMGAVYRATDAVGQSQVAIKVMNREVTRDSISARRFAKEARMLARANNPYVANLFDVNIESATPYMAVELVEGGTLGSRLTGRAMNDHLAVTLIADTVRGLAIAHRRGIVHRDYKPDNILLTTEGAQWLERLYTHATPIDDGESEGAPPTTQQIPQGSIFAKVSDFGLARAAQQTESMSMTREGALLGTPLYMSPEQCRGETATQASDVYSVGVTLFQLLCGRPPFESDSQVGVINKHCNEPPPSLKQLQPDLPEILVQIVEKCLAKNADARYESAEQLLEDLDNYLRGEPTSLRLHPPILATQDRESLTFEHQWQMQSSPNQLWPYISNTDRVNHAMGLPAVQYSIRHDPIEGTQRFAEAKIAGQRIRWLEHPYEWIEGRRLSVLREFTHGPFIWFVNVVELIPSPGGGTLVKQTLTVKPRNWLGKQIAKLQLGKKSRENFGQTYRNVDQYLTQSESAKADRDPFITKTEVTPAQRQKLTGRLQSLREQKLNPQVIDTLEQFLLHASDLDVARIRPLAFAERFQLDPIEVVEVCLWSVKQGVLNLLWDIICPSCRIPANIQETLTNIKSHGECEACNLRFDIDLMESVELIFRTHPEIREAETRTYCVGGPAWSRHVVAQVRLANTERFACELSLGEGAYLIRGPLLPFVIDFRVAHGGQLGRVEMPLGTPPSKSQKWNFQLGSQVIHLCNDSGQDQHIRIERVAARGDALSAAKASTLALFRELFPGEVLAGDQIVSVTHITLMRVRIHQTRELYRSLGDGPAFLRVRKCLDQMLRVVKENVGAVVKVVGEGVLASFSKPTDAISAAHRLVHQSEPDSLPLSAAIHAGTAMVATLDDRLDYFGTALQDLESYIEVSQPNQILLSTSFAEMQDVNDHLAHLDTRLDINRSPEAETRGITTLEILSGEKLV